MCFNVARQYYDHGRRSIMEKYALLIGGSKFESSGLLSLHYVENDVNDFSEVLLEKFLVPYDHIYIIQDGDCNKIWMEVKSICDTVNDGDEVIIYCATHGKVYYNEPYIATYNAVAGDSVSGWINTAGLCGAFLDKGCNVLAFLDCCQSTFFPMGPRSETSPSCSLHTERYYVAFSAAGPDEDANESYELQHGCWTYFLISALQGKEPSAFVPGTHRISISTLQDFLHKKVSQFVYNAFGKRQTPYKSSTVSNDNLTIIEQEFSDNMVDIKNIYFGSIDADLEMEESKDTFIENYFDLDGALEKIQSNIIRLIIGDKGTGKTYLEKYLECTSNCFYQTVRKISPAHLEEVTVAQQNQKGKYIDAWKYTLYTLLICHIVKNKMPGFQDFECILTAIYKNKTARILDNPLKRIKWLLNQNLKSNLNLPKQFDEYAENPPYFKINDLVQLYEDLFNQFYTDDFLYYFVDGCDEQIRGALSEKQKSILLDLLTMVSDSHSELDKIRIIPLFRNDILKSLDGEANMNKIIQGRSVKLDWLSTDRNWSNTPLYRLIEKRIKTSTRDQSVNLSSILPAKMPKYGTAWEWILNFTRYRPRDIVSFLNKCKEFAVPSQEVFTEANLWDALRPYSEYLWKEYCDVLAGTVFSNYTSQLATFLDKVGTYLRNHQKKEFSYPQFRELYDSSDLGSVIDRDTALKVLYETGIIGAFPHGSEYWYFRENPIEYDADTWREYKFRIHCGIWKKFHIW